VLAVIPQFEMTTGATVSAKWALYTEVRTRIEAGKPFDLVIINPTMIQELTASGKVAVGSQVAFGRAAMGMAVRAGRAPPDIGSLEAFEHSLKAAGSIAYASEGSSGAYFTDLLERLGIAHEVKPKLVAVTGGRTAAAVGLGEAELGVVPVTSILAAAPGVMLAGRFPEELQSYIEFAVGICTDSSDANAAGQLTDFLISTAVDDILAARGVERLQT